MGGNLRYKIGLAIFALFSFVFEGKFQVQAPLGLIFGGAI